jgi:hypothetical protein
MMESIRELFRRVTSFFRREKLDQELDAELAAHLELAVEENLQRGMTTEEARRPGATMWSSSAGNSGRGASLRTR